MKLSVYYDGECPFCANFVQFSRLRSKFDVSLFDLRETPEKVSYFVNKGYDVNQGMVVVLDDSIYFGHEAIYMIAALSNKNKFIGSVYFFFFSNKKVTKLLYPIMKIVRNFTLLILRRKKI